MLSVKLEGSDCSDSLFQTCSCRFFSQCQIDKGKFNYMLIPGPVKSAVANGLLIPAKPIASWAGERRIVLQCKEISTALAIGRGAADEKERSSWAKIEAAFSHFIEGGAVTENLLKQLEPGKFEHWEFRCSKPKPSLRVFGRFAAPDIFVATHHRPRTLLGGMWSPQFEHEKLICEDHWKAAGLGGAVQCSARF